MIRHLYRRFIFTSMDGIPRILYKYRDWENSFHKNLLIQFEIFLAPACSFNVPFDASFPLRYDPKELTPDKIFIKYVQLAKLNYPHFTEKEIHEYVYKHQSEDLLFDEHHLARHNVESQERFDRAFGILSLSAKQDNFLMWSHYANSHKGLCVGIDSSKLFGQLGVALGKIN
ncbi:DUF2971 domain-containing protein [Pontibacter flavimaris]|uniref:DUF2971 domain-containing protein n=1 Tax=Pontibacter flavimaris TaxID=1797110 RepID=A0A1Q5PIM4_9BACT|nr:DUF2971 domain-containing protein [Pontibacter flavimaris]OKL42068.1 hypothetical protein A3841_08710 [Pontibacter flavimaris]